jgi:hypothetical protein
MNSEVFRLTIGLALCSSFPLLAVWDYWGSAACEKAFEWFMVLIYLLLVVYLLAIGQFLPVPALAVGAGLCVHEVHKEKVKRVRSNSLQ